MASICDTIARQIYVKTVEKILRERTTRFDILFDFLMDQCNKDRVLIRDDQFENFGSWCSCLWFTINRRSLVITGSDISVLGP